MTRTKSAFDIRAVQQGADAPATFKLDETIARLAHWLPTQGPLKDFIHHNTLHAVQDRPFHEGVSIAARVFGARSYLPLADYQARYRAGRITNQAIDWAIAQSGADPKARLGLRHSLFIADDAQPYPPRSIAKHGIRSSWLAKLEVNLNALVHPVLFRLLGNFLDQGISRWTLSQDSERFWECVWRLTHNTLIPLEPFDRTATKELFAQEPDAVIIHCLERLVGCEDLYEQYLMEMLLNHPGWSGMVRLVEKNPKVLLAPRRISLKETIAFELACELAFLTRKRGTHFMKVADVPLPVGVPLLQNGLLRPSVPLMLRVWHEAFEYALHHELLGALAHVSPTFVATPRAQALFCIDDRECSLRRHLENVIHDVETFGAAGFFGIEFLYRGLDDVYPVAQCPVLVQPGHLVIETTQVGPEPESAQTMRDLANLHFTPHSLLRGWLLTQTLGLGYAIRLALNVFKPGAKPIQIRGLGDVDAHTHLHLVRQHDEPTAGGYLLGFSYSEMADRIEGLLRNIGLVTNFAPVIVVVAHGSSSVNNPHFAAYDCGACSGKPGAPNARAFAWMANSPRVREILRERGIAIPATTRFVPALHNTSRDEITYFDQDTALTAHSELKDFHTVFAEFKAAMESALRLNAAERCRWFELAPNKGGLDAYIEHVRERASAIFEPRPELNHSNNLYCVVGRRALTRHLFMDRRAFLHSYHPGSDPDGSTLAKILSAVIPVCGGINLEYLFSRIDNSAYGSGSKLPHNVIGLLGVANGVQGDLRTGLPSQMIEVHEPARLLIVVEQSLEILKKALLKLGELVEWVDNHWVRLACHDPDNRETWLLGEDGWGRVGDGDLLPAAGPDSYGTPMVKDYTSRPVSILEKSN